MSRAELTSAHSPRRVGLFGHGKLPSPVMEIFTRNCETFEKPVEGAKVCSDAP